MNYFFANHAQKRSCNIAVKHTDSIKEKETMLKDETTGSFSSKSMPWVDSGTKIKTQMSSLDEIIKNTKEGNF